MFIKRTKLVPNTETKTNRFSKNPIRRPEGNNGVLDFGLSDQLRF